MGQVDESSFQPRTPVEIFKRSVAECVRAGGAVWMTVVAIMLAPSAIAVVGQYILWHSGTGEFLEQMQKGSIDPVTIDKAELFSSIAIAVVIGGISGILSFAAQYASGVAVARMVAERALGRSLQPMAALDFIIGRTGKIIGGVVVLMVAVIVAAVIGEIPGGIVAAVVTAAAGPAQAGAQPPLLARLAPIVTMVPVMLALAVYIISMTAVTGIENQGGLAAISRSWRLSTGQFLHVLGAVALTGLVFGAPSMAVGALGQTGLATQLREAMGGAAGMAAISGLSSLLSLALTPFLVTMQVVVYLDLRSRQAAERFTPYDLAIDLGGDLPEGVSRPLDDDGTPLPPAP